jgi:hypothetical protein
MPSNIKDSSRLGRLAIVAILAALALAPSAQARPFDTGLLDLNTFEHGDSLAFGRARAAGARFLKITLYWPRVAPAPDSATKPVFTETNPADPAYNWTDYDTQIRLAVANGLEVILGITNAPRWAREGCTSSVVCSPDPAEFAAFAQAAATRYSGGFDPGPYSETLPRVSHFQAWLEPNLEFFYLPVFENGQVVAPTNYRRILNAFADAVHAVDDTNKVLTGGLAPLKRTGAALGPLDFMRRMLCMQGRTPPRPQPGCSARSKFDIWTTHPYTTGGPLHSGPDPDDVSLGDLPEMTTLLRAADRAGKIQNTSANTPFWVTEFSWDSSPPDPGGISLALQARWLAEAFYRMWDAGVSAVLWWQLRDEPANGRPHSEVYESGLYRSGATLAGDRPKPALRAFKFPFVALKTGRNTLLIWGRTPGSDRRSVVVEFAPPGGGYRRLLRISSDGDGIFTRTIRSPQVARMTRGLRRGFVRAKVTGEPASLPFSLTYVKDFYQPPFGG